MKKLVVFVLSALLVACATGSDKKAPREKAPKPPVAKEKAAKNDANKQKAKAKEYLAETNPSPNVTLAQNEGDLADIVLNLSQNVGGSLVLVNGIERKTIPAVNVKNEKFSNFVQQLAAMASCKYQECPNYWFLYPDGYEPVLNVSLQGKLDKAYADKSAGMAFGSDTPLYAALALLSDSLGITVIADNIVAESRCGSLTLAQIPFQDALEALLKSARLLPELFQVESTAEYIFIYATHNATPPSVLLDRENVTPEQNAFLDKKVDVTLPDAPDETRQGPMAIGATALAKVLDTLSNSLGVTVTVEPGIDEFPVNPCVMRQVSVRTAMDLLIRQWFQAEVGYRVDGDHIVIERKK